MKKWYFISPIFIFALWSLLTYVGIVNNVIIPPPHKVMVEFWRYSASGEVIIDILPTLKCMFLGLSIGTTIGISLGVLLGYFTKLYEALDFVIDFFRSIPATALFPIFMLMFGLGISSRVMMVAYGTSFIMLINTMYGVKNSKNIRVVAARTMGALKLDILTKVVLPDALPYITAGLRIALSTALVITIVGEMFIGTYAGLGYRIMNSKVLYDIPNVFAALITTGLLGYALNKAFIFTERRIVHWSGE